MKKITFFLAFFVFVGINLVHAQGLKITGTVTSSEDGLPVPGATIVVENNTTIGTSTNIDGYYELTVPSDSENLVFSSVGMKAVTEAINGRSVINVVLEPDVLEMDEVVVTALGISREKKALGYSVQDVKGEELSQSRDANIVNALSGKVAGVQITAASGAVGSSSRITIRGNSSFGNNQPLWIVDGTPLSNYSSSVSQWGGNDFGNAAMDIDPSNIESISVLKGASAAALYGSRAANGVILVTTKSGQKGGKGKGGVGVSYNTSLTFDQVYILPNFQDEYGQGYGGSIHRWYEYDPTSSYQDFAEGAFTYVDGNWGGAWDGMDESWGPKLDVGLELAQFDSPYVNGEYTPTPWVSQPDNVKDFFETGITWDNNLSMTTASDKANARLSLSSQDIQGAIPNTDLTKYTVAFNGGLNLTDKLTANAKVTYVNNSSDNLPGGGYDAGNIMQSMSGWFGRQVNMQSLKDNWDTMGPNGMPYNWNTSYHNNPYWTVNNNTTSRRRDRIFGNVNLSYQLTDWLNVMGRAGTDWYNETRKSVIYHLSNQNSNGGEFDLTERFENEINFDLIFTYDKELTSDLRINGSLGANYRNRKYQWQRIQAFELTVPNLFTIGNVSGDPGVGMYEEEKETNSVFGSANIAFRNYLFLDITARNDWSSTLPSDEQSYFYPGVSLGFIFTDAFGIGGNILSYGKVRGSWAQVGNDTDPYQTMGSYEASASTFGGVTQYFFGRELPPIGLRPEKTTEIEFGAELKFFNNRLGVDFTYYDKKTVDQIMGVQISSASGFNSMRINAGEIQNSGVELMLTGKVLQSKSGLNWDIVVNWAKNNNTVNKLYGDLEAYQIASSWGSVTVEARPGETYGVIKGGGYIYDDNGNIVINPASGLPYKDGPVELGNITPDWVGGIRNSFSYKGINFSFLVDARWGGDLFSVSDWFGAYAGITEETAQGNIREYGMVVDGVLGTQNDDGTWTYSGTNNITVDPEDYYSNYWNLHEQSVIDGTYIKLREVVLGYNIPQKIMDKVGFIQSANIAFVGRNLALLYTHPSNDVGIDPETGFGTGNAGMGIEQNQLPPTRSLGFKLSVNF